MAIAGISRRALLALRPIVASPIRQHRPFQSIACLLSDRGWMSPVADGGKENFGQGRRDYEVSLMFNQQMGHFVKITEFSRERRSSVLLAVADVPTFLEQLEGLSTGGSKVGHARLDCSAMTEKYFELTLNTNNFGQFYRINEQNPIFKKRGSIMMEYEGHNQLVAAVRKVLGQVKEEKNVDKESIDDSLA